MSCARAVNWKLRNDPGVAAIVAGRVFPVLADEAENEYPRVVYLCESDAEEMTATGGTGLSVQKVKVYALALTYAGQQSLSSAIRAALNGQSGTWDTVVVQGAFFEDANESQQTNDAGPDSIVQVCELEFTVAYEVGS